ncbi:MAG: haloacid dehalogenase-like hydrolase [Thermoanaerobaculum sp.]|nr:haloacid dehalogenase-like hydrolase [Thermoanaerobaculum sp.]MDW7968144.1 haloacid dehalogenase-like hydrolase [Thermoanaerobaculum sp.]
MRVLVLFDVDGTLISTGGRAFAALREAFRQVVGVEPPTAGYSPAGKTDPQIVRELLGRLGDGHQDHGQKVAQVLAVYPPLLRQLLQPPYVRPLSGVEALVAQLARHPQVALGLLTGNLEEGAEIKLSLAGLWHLFPVGAFGSDDPDRNRLLPFAWQRAKAFYGQDFPPERTVVVGDTPADVACAKVWKARAVAVAGHTHSLATLAAAKPDAVLPSLLPELFLPVLFALSPSSRPG